MDMSYYYVVLLLFKAIIAEEGFRSKDINPMFNYDLEVDESKKISYISENPNNSNIYYLKKKLHPNNFLSNVGFENEVLNEDTEVKQPPLESNMSEDEINVNHSNELRTLISNTSNEETLIDSSRTPLEVTINPSELERDNNRLGYPETIIDNNTNNENTIDVPSNLKEFSFTNNYEYSISNEPQSSDIFENIFMTVQDNKNEKELNLKDAVTTLQFERQNTMEVDLPKLTLNNLPITGPCFQPNLLMNILAKNTPGCHSHLQHNNLLIPKLRGGLRPYYFIKNLPSRKIIFTHI